MQSKLREFLLEKMRMTGPYQPVIIRELVKNGGRASLDEIAKTLAALDRESIAYYREKLTVYPKAVLKKHKIAEVVGDEYTLNSALLPKPGEIEELADICEQKIAEYYSRSEGDEEVSRGWGLLRVKLITAQPYCGYCGARPGTSSDVELDIDHIIPRAKGGGDDIENLQVLCHRCNRAKNHYLLPEASATLIREKQMAYTPDCIFCDAVKTRALFQNEYAYVMLDGFPVSAGHTLIIPTRHIADAGLLTDVELVHIFGYYREIASSLKAKDPTITGFNIGFNIGKSAGQTVFHAHFHVIPRREGDVADPTGGVRNVIAGKGRYG